MELLGKPRPRGYTAHDAKTALELGKKFKYPIVVRPSYVLGGRGMEVITNEEGLENYLKTTDATRGWPLLMDSYLAGVEVEVDAVGDGEDVDRKSTRLNSSHVRISYAVFCLKKKKKKRAN